MIDSRDKRSPIASTLPETLALSTARIGFASVSATRNPPSDRVKERPPPASISALETENEAARPVMWPVPSMPRRRHARQKIEARIPQRKIDEDLPVAGRVIGSHRLKIGGVEIDLNGAPFDDSAAGARQ